MMCSCMASVGSSSSSSGEENHNRPSSVSSAAAGLATILLFGVKITVTEAPALETVAVQEIQVTDVPHVVDDNNTNVDVDVDRWTIKKKLHKSDVDGSSRLLLGKQAVERHMLPHLGEFEKKIGMELVLYDVDTRTEHRVTLKTWITKSYTLIKGWKKDFVKRRGLTKNDEIGIRWQQNHQRFEFTLLHKAPIKID